MELSLVLTMGVKRFLACDTSFDAHTAPPTMAVLLVSIAARLAIRSLYLPLLLLPVDVHDLAIIGHG